MGLPHFGFFRDATALLCIYDSAPLYHASSRKSSIKAHTCGIAFYAFISSTNSLGFTVISTHAGLKPHFIAFRAEAIFDHAQQ